MFFILNKVTLIFLGIHHDLDLLPGEVLHVLLHDDLWLVHHPRLISKEGSFSEPRHWDPSLAAKTSVTFQREVG